MYDPSIGRFLQRDPIGYEDSMNLYAFVGNNSINYIDPWGLWEIKSRPLENPVASQLGYWLYDDDKLAEHWQIFLDNGKNIGYLGDDPNNKNKPLIASDSAFNLGKYNKTPIYSGTDDDIIQEAVFKAKYQWEQAYDEGQRYHHNLGDDQKSFDCQDFAWTVLSEYQKIKKNKMSLK